MEGNRMGKPIVSVKCSVKSGGKNRVAVRVVKFTAICTAFSYQDKKKYAKIYQDRVLRENG